MVQVYLDEDAMVANSCQIYPDSAPILSHWQLSDSYIQQVNQHMTMSRLEIYGDPGAAVMDGLRTPAAEGVVVSVRPWFCGCGRFAEPVA